MPTPSEITTHHDPDPDENPWVHGAPIQQNISVVPYDSAWVDTYRTLERQIVEALGPAAMQIEHVGSTSVPGLAAKPVIDIDLTVPDSTDENTYIPALEALGFDLTVRERSWHEHRCLVLDDPRTNLHVFSPDCPEVIRHRIFRDWLIDHPDDRERYQAAKLDARVGVQTVPDYNQRKQPVIREIYDRAFRAAGLL
jgi:GrpB-like predicted nucleotidyltransferase (UPF0157 family)